MRDISARELKGHNILAVERFWDDTSWMIEFFRPASQHSLRQSRRGNAAVFDRGRVSGRSAKPAAPGDQDQALRSCD